MGDTRASFLVVGLGAVTDALLPGQPAGSLARQPGSGTVRTVTSTPGWHISGTYLEACNCDVICPCRRIGGRSGGRSTYGVCEGALSWAIERGHVDEVDMGGLAAVLACRYDDDEPGSPWDFFLYLDERGDERQRAALEAILTGAWGGTALVHFPWAFKPSRRLAVRAVPIEVDRSPRRGWFRAGEYVEVRVGDPVDDQETVTCVIPGHHRSGTEHVAELLHVSDAPLGVELSGRCAYQSTFEYASA